MKGKLKNPAILAFSNLLSYCFLQGTEKCRWGWLTIEPSTSPIRSRLTNHSTLILVTKDKNDFSAVRFFTQLLFSNLSQTILRLKSIYVGYNSLSSPQVSAFLHLLPNSPATATAAPVMLQRYIPTIISIFFCNGWMNKAVPRQLIMHRNNVLCRSHA